MKPLVSLLLLFIFNSAIAQEEIAKAVEKTVMDNIRYMSQEDTTMVMSTLHPNSATYNPTLQAINQLFPTYDLNYKILSFKFISYDGELAYARVKQLTTKVSGPAFRNNELDMLQVFKKEGGTWKLWSQANMSINYLN